MTKKATFTLLLIVCAKALVFSGSIVLTQIIAKLYGVETVGIFSAIFAAIFLMSLLFRAGLPILLLRSSVRFPNSEPQQIYDLMQKRMFELNSRWIFVASVYFFLLIFFSGYLQNKTYLHYFLTLTPLILLASWLQLRASYLKVSGNRLQAAWNDLGLLHIVLALFVLVFWAFSNEISLLNILTIFSLISCFVVCYIWFKLPKAPLKHELKVEHQEQNRVMLNAVLTFIYRSGYPLIFTLFVTASDIGSFRLEERMALATTFIFLLFETLVMKRMVQDLKGKENAEVRPVYIRYLVLVIVPSIIVAGISAVVFSFSDVREFFSLSTDGELKLLVFLVAPFYILVQFNTLFLNLSGKFRTITLNMILISGLFITASSVLYNFLGLTGLRFAYGATGILAALWTSAVTIKMLGFFKEVGDE